MNECQICGGYMVVYPPDLFVCMDCGYDEDINDKGVEE